MECCQAAPAPGASDSRLSGVVRGIENADDVILFERAELAQETRRRESEDGPLSSQ